jgi:hypothetical protein
VSNRCDQCKHWKQNDEYDQVPEIGFGRCSAVEPRWKIEDEADRDRDFAEVRLSALRIAGAYVQDADSHYAALFTGPDFFCALYEAKP